jgi:hypothetical protein
MKKILAGNTRNTLCVNQLAIGEFDMAWLSVDKNGDENISNNKPWRSGAKGFNSWDTHDPLVYLPKGSIKRLIGCELTWGDEPVEFVENIEPNIDDDIKSVNCILFKEYADLSESAKDMCNTAIVQCKEFTVDKHSRWLGFVQGVLFKEGLLNIELTRNSTRQLFQEVYKKYGITQKRIDVIGEV